MTLRELLIGNGTIVPAPEGADDPTVRSEAAVSRWLAECHPTWRTLRLEDDVA